MRVQIIKEVPRKEDGIGEWTLCFQWCQYVYDDGNSQYGYRFIWRTPEGHLQPARGQARIPSIKEANYLMQLAKDDGWGDHDGD